MTGDLVSAGNENLRTAFERLADEADAGASRRFGPVAAACVGVPVPLFNRAFVFEAPPPGDLSAAVDWLADRDVPFLVTVVDGVREDVSDHLADCGLTTVGEQPGMAMSSLDELPSPDSVVDVTEVTDPGAREAFSTVTASAFEMPPDVAARIDRAALAADDVRLFLGRADGRPAASGLLVRSGDAAGVYSVGVLEAFRRQGIGAAMTWTVLRAGREAGCRVGVLQSSEMGYPLYEGMGFETVVTYHQFGPSD